MKTIWKYELEITDLQTVKMPESSIIMTVDKQHNKLCLWVLVDPSKELEDRQIEVIGTGHPIDESITRFYISTVVMDPFVWHVFERVEF